MHYCSNCGNQMEDNVTFCPSCGAKQNVAADNVQPVAEQPQGEQFNQTAQPQRPIISDWDGGVLDTIANSLVASLLTSVTCGIALPWAMCYIYKFILSHAIINGKRLTFDGKGSQLFGNYIKWFFLTLITCGIYGFWVTPKLYKWIVSHTHFEQ